MHTNFNLELNVPAAKPEQKLELSAIHFHGLPASSYGGPGDDARCADAPGLISRKVAAVGRAEECFVSQGKSFVSPPYVARMIEHH